MQTIEQLIARAESAEREVERLKADGAASAFITMSCRASRAETDRNNLRADLDAIKAILTEEKDRASRAEAELAGIRALADRRNERDHSQDTTHQLVAALDQALDIAQAELAAERTRLDWLELHGHFGYKIGTVWSDYFAVDLAGGEKTTLRAAINAAMEEGA